MPIVLKTKILPERVIEINLDARGVFMDSIHEVDIVPATPEDAVKMTKFWNTPINKDLEDTGLLDPRRDWNWSHKLNSTTAHNDVLSSERLALVDKRNIAPVIAFTEDVMAFLITADET